VDPCLISTLTCSLPLSPFSHISPLYSYINPLLFSPPSLSFLLLLYIEGKGERKKEEEEKVREERMRERLYRGRGGREGKERKERKSERQN